MKKNNAILYAMSLATEDTIEAHDIVDETKDAYEIGRSQGFSEAIDTIYNALDVRDYDLSELKFKPDDLINRLWRK